ncbi:MULTISPECIES: hypothetical protein [Serratia]|uniref:hypothetical protein n=1 Tax=Serratia TaxID=613 RepID=UPI002DB65AE4|nr:MULTISPECIES: hypothetical protein [Serratia]MEB6337662.1 hypothetical protein [Serratia rhizosphaerae]MEB7588113.1 hypothetical protein [Serratia rubidaea]
MKMFIEDKGRVVFSVGSEADILKFINLTALCREFDISFQTVKTRLNNGIPLQQALTLPKHYHLKG